MAIQNIGVSAATETVGPDHVPHTKDKYKYLIGSSTGTIPLPAGYGPANPLVGDMILVGGGSGSNGMHGGGGGQIALYTSQTFTSGIPVVIGAGGAANADGEKTYITSGTQLTVGIAENFSLMDGNKWLWKGPTSGGSGSYTFNIPTNTPIENVSSYSIRSTYTTLNVNSGPLYIHNGYNYVFSGSNTYKSASNAASEYADADTHFHNAYDMDMKFPYAGRFSVSGDGNYWNTSIFQSCSGSAEGFNNRFVWQYANSIPVTAGQIVEFGFYEAGDNYYDSSEYYVTHSRGVGQVVGNLKWSDGTRASGASLYITNPNTFYGYHSSYGNKTYGYTPRFYVMRATVPAGVTSVKPEIHQYEGYQYWSGNGLGLYSMNHSWGMPWIRVYSTVLANPPKGPYIIGGRKYYYNSTYSTPTSVYVRRADIMSVNGDTTTSDITATYITKFAMGGSTSSTTKGSVSGYNASSSAIVPSAANSNRGGRGGFSAIVSNHTALTVSSGYGTQTVTMGRVQMGGGGGGAVSVGKDSFAVDGRGGEGGEGFLYRVPTESGSPMSIIANSTTPGFSTREGGWVFGGGGGGAGVVPGIGRHGGGDGGVVNVGDTNITPSTSITGTNGIANTGGGGGGNGGSGGSGVLIVRYL